MPDNEKTTYWEAAAPYVAASGSENEQQRYAAGVLPPADLDAVVARGLWTNLSGPGFYVRRRLHHADVEDLAVKRGKAQKGDTVTFEIIEGVDELTGEQWDVLQRIEKAAPQGTEVTTFYVIAYCGDFTTKRACARLTHIVGGRPFKLELCLD